MGAIFSMNTAFKNNSIIRKTALYKYFRKDKVVFDTVSRDNYQRLKENPLLVARLQKAERNRKRKEVFYFLMLFILVVLIGVLSISFFDEFIQLMQKLGIFGVSTRELNLSF